MISIDDFKKIEIKIGKVLSAERIPDSDKLLKLSVDFGEEGPRQILAGIAEHIVDPTSLVGREMPFVTNLEPRKLRGEMSEGMMLVASDETSISLLHPEKDVPPGSIVR